MRHWLIKFAPFRTSWTDIVRTGSFTLRGVRSSEACKHLATMRTGDPVLYYHSQRERAVVWVLEVTGTSYPDPTSADSRWLTCDFRPVQRLSRPVSLAELRQEDRLVGLRLLRQPRLAVMPITSLEFASIIAIAARAS